jgi:hypothetical protein
VGRDHKVPVAKHQGYNHRRPVIANTPNHVDCEESKLIPSVSSHSILLYTKSGAPLLQAERHQNLVGALVEQLRLANQCAGAVNGSASKIKGCVPIAMPSLSLVTGKSPTRIAVMIGPNVLINFARRTL